MAFKNLKIHKKISIFYQLHAIQGSRTKGRMTKGRMTKGKMKKRRTFKKQNDQKVE